MKRVISIFLILIILSTVLAIFAAGFDAGGFTYTASGTNATLTGWASSSGTVTIPATVSNGGTTYKVTAIGDYAFANKPSITKVNFSGSNLTTIGEGAFSTNRSCTSLTIPASVTTIEARAFHSWVSLSTLTFNNGSNLSTIGNWAFRNAQSLSKLNFPDKASGSITIGEGAFSYCNSITSVDFPECVSTIGEESFIGCINLASVTIRKENASIGNNAFDLTSSTGRNRTLVVKGHSGSSASRFATAEGFTFKLLPNAANEEAVPTPTAGSYYVKVTGSLKGSKTLFVSSTTLNNEFTAGWGEATNDSAGMVIRYKANNGTATTTADKTVDLHGSVSTTETAKTGSATIPGFPTGFYFCLDQNDVPSLNTTLKITKIQVGASSSSNLTTIWSGTIQLESTNATKYATIEIDGNKTTSSNASVSSNPGWTLPTPNSLGALTGDSTATVNTDGTTYRSGAYTYGKITDQYGVQMAQNPTISVSSSTGITGISFDKDYGRLVLTSQANRSPSTYTVNIKQTAGSKSNTKSVTVTTFDYNVTFSYFEGTKAKTVTQTVNYGASPTDPGVTPVKYDSDGHQLFDGWSDEATATYTDGPQEVTAMAKYKAIASHSFGNQVTSEATCTEPEQLIQTCSACGYDKITEGDPALGHTGDTVVSEIAPTDNTPGIAYFTCTRCHTCWSAVKNNGVFTKDVSSELEPVNGQPNIAQIIQDAPQENFMTPAPAFNRFVAEEINYDYSKRGGSLKIAGDSNIDLSSCANNSSSPLLTSVTQGMRFTASMHIPDGVSLSDTGSGNRLTDFGYVWSQTEVAHPDENIANLEEGKTRVYKTSVVNNNSGNGTFTGSNWTGVSAHDDTLSDGGKTLTFNLVVNVKARNWKRDYCARAYIKYVYNDKEYTVYDQSYSSRSVEYIATAVVGSPYESQKVKNFLQTKVYNNLQYVPE